MIVIRINHDDSPLDVADKLNAALKAAGLRLEDDGQAHDGYVALTLKPDPGPLALLRKLAGYTAGISVPGAPGDLNRLAQEAKRLLEGPVNDACPITAGWIASAAYVVEMPDGSRYEAEYDPERDVLIVGERLSDGQQPARAREKGVPHGNASPPR